jgi:hypothetical protein
MTIVQISKKRLIKALENEPLRNLNPGAWVDETLSPSGDIKAKDCPVCAVGAVMRDVLSPATPLYEIDNAANAATEAWGVTMPVDRDKYDYATNKYVRVKVSNKMVLTEAAKDIKNSPMAALSQAFEGLCELAIERGANGLSRQQIARIRKALVGWVKKNYPNQVLIDINGASAAKDVKVVST